MASRQWSRETVVADHQGLQCSSLTLSGDGTICALAGRKYLALINLDVPDQVIKKVNLGNRWEVKSVAWNKTHDYSNSIALASHDRIDLYRCENGNLCSFGLLRGHSRQISDINWNPVKGPLLASSALDGNIHIWDMRDSTRPGVTFSTMVGANHVRWSKSNGNLLAAAHEADLRIWDVRSPGGPVCQNSPHLSRILSVDWCSNDSNSLVTSSSDCTVKFHNHLGSTLETAGKGLTTTVPIWRARHTPFGDGLVTVLVPHLRTHDHSVFLWKSSNLSNPVHSFIGHRDVIFDFEWRSVYSTFQLITWSKDQTIRIWNICDDIKLRCGVESEIRVNDFSIGGDIEEGDQLEAVTEAIEAIEGMEAIYIDQNKGVISRTNSKPLFEEPVAKIPMSHSVIMKESPLKESSPTLMLGEIDPLRQEFMLLDTSNYSYLRVLERDLENRTCRIVASTQYLRFAILITFPPAYPMHTPPIFTCLPGSTASQEVRTKLMKLMQETATHQVKRKRACLERCLRQLECQLAQLGQDSGTDTMTAKQAFLLQESTKFAGSQSSSVPYPRTSGATFCSNDLLVCFGRPAYTMQVNSGGQNTPRSYSAFLAAVPRNASDQSVFNSGNLPGRSDPGDRSINTVRRGRFKVKRVGSNCQEEKNVRSRKAVLSRRTSTYGGGGGVALTVTLYHVAGLLPIDRNLARDYVVLEDTKRMCQENERVAERLNRSDLAHVWRMAGEVAEAARKMESVTVGGCEAALIKDLMAPWGEYPLGARLIQSIMDEYRKFRDFQTLALLVCAFTNQSKTVRKTSLVLGVEVSSIATTSNTSYPERKTEVNKEKYWFLKPNALGISGGKGDSPYHTVHAAVCNRPSSPRSALNYGGHMNGLPHNHTTLGPLSTLSRLPTSRNYTNTIGPLHLPSQQAFHAGGSNPNLEKLFTRGFRSNSWSDAMKDDDEVSTDSSSSSGSANPVMFGEPKGGLLLMENSQLYISALDLYSNYLYNSGLLLRRVEVEKHIGFVKHSEKHHNMIFNNLCSHCSTKLMARWCAKCSKPSLTCQICCLPVRGLSVLCPSCGHGGHIGHIKDWFAGGKEVCASGCGCPCLEFMHTPSPPRAID